MQRTINELMDKGIRSENIIILIWTNVDVKAEQLDNLIQSLCHGIKGLKYRFIDEIHSISDFESVLNGYREEEEYSIFITGSNSYLLSGERTMKLTGRVKPPIRGLEQARITFGILAKNIR